MALRPEEVGVAADHDVLFHQPNIPEKVKVATDLPESGEVSIYEGHEYVGVNLIFDRVREVSHHRQEKIWHDPLKAQHDTPFVVTTGRIHGIENGNHGWWRPARRLVLLNVLNTARI
jgi:hypothetical protein